MVVCSFGLLSASGMAQGPEGSRLPDIGTLQRACEVAAGEPVLHWVEIRNPAMEYDADVGQVVVQTNGRNLALFGGAAELLALEPIGLLANPGRAEELLRASQEGARLRVGFVMGLEDAQVCVRPSFSVTVVRASLAFTELVDREGAVLGRDDRAVLRHWQSARPRSRQRVEIGELLGAGVPEGNAARVSRGLSGFAQCFESALERGAGFENADVSMELTVEQGRVRRIEVPMTTLRDEQAMGCLREVSEGLRLENGSYRMTIPLHFRSR